MSSALLSQRPGDGGGQAAVRGGGRPLGCGPGGQPGRAAATPLGKQLP